MVTRLVDGELLLEDSSGLQQATFEVLHTKYVVSEGKRKESLSQHYGNYSIAPSKSFNARLEIGVPVLDLLAAALAQPAQSCCGHPQNVTCLFSPYEHVGEANGWVRLGFAPFYHTDRPLGEIMDVLILFWRFDE